MNYLFEEDTEVKKNIGQKVTFPHFNDQGVNSQKSANYSLSKKSKAFPDP
jgi:hypothetical protein